MSQGCCGYSYSGAQNVSGSFRLFKFFHLKRWERFVMFIRGLIQPSQTKCKNKVHTMGISHQQTSKISSPHRSVCSSLKSFSILRSLSVLMAPVWTRYLNQRHPSTYLNSQTEESPLWPGTKSLSGHQGQDGSPAQDEDEPNYNRQAARWEEACWFQQSIQCLNWQITATSQPDDDQSALCVRV